MVKYLVQVIQNALPPAILVSLLYAVFYGRGGEIQEQRGPKGRMMAGGIAGTTAALILAILRSTTRLINREYVNTAALSLAILGGLLCVLLVPAFLSNPSGDKTPGGNSGAAGAKSPRVRSRVRSRIREAIPSYAGAALTALLLFYALPTLFLYPREFVAPGESPFSTDVLFKLLGYGAGLLVVILSALALYEAGKTLPPRPVGILLSLSLGVNMVNQLAVIVQFLLARRFIRLPRPVFRIMVGLINYNAIFLYALMGISIILPILLFIQSLRIREPYRNPAELRKLRAVKRDQRRWSGVILSAYVLSILSLTVVKSYAERPPVLTAAEPMTIRGGEIIIPIEKIEDGHLHRYNYAAEENIAMRFIVIRKNEAAYGVGLDACDICGPTGYYERKDGVVCRLCDVVMNISTIGFKGGCNPVPLAYTMREGNMVIQTADLETERHRFK
jgi:uncharacterized membrane protein